MFILCLTVVFTLQMSSIKRLIPRLKSMLFKRSFPELVSDIKPVSESIVYPCVMCIVKCTAVESWLKSAELEKSVQILNYKSN